MEALGAISFFVIAACVMTFPVMFVARILKTENSSLLTCLVALVLTGIIFQVTQSKVSSQTVVYLIAFAISCVLYTSLFSTSFKKASLLASTSVVLHLLGVNFGVTINLN